MATIPSHATVSNIPADGSIPQVLVDFQAKAWARVVFSLKKLEVKLQRELTQKILDSEQTVLSAYQESHGNAIRSIFDLAFMDKDRIRKTNLQRVYLLIERMLEIPLEHDTRVAWDNTLKALIDEVHKRIVVQRPTLTTTKEKCLACEKYLVGTCYCVFHLKEKCPWPPEARKNNSRCTCTRSRGNVL